MSAFAFRLEAEAAAAVRAWVWAIQQLNDLMNGLFRRYTFKVKTGRGGRRKRRARRARGAA